jgi:pimeloyl-ACP methyl ester carboxylesterase
LLCRSDFLEWHLFHDCLPQAVEQYWIETDLPLRKIYETPFTAPNSMKTVHFIVGTGDRTLQRRAQRLTSELLPHASVSEIETGHFPHIAAPVGLANLILSLTGAAHR